MGRELSGSTGEVSASAGGIRDRYQGLDARRESGTSLVVVRALLAAAQARSLSAPELSALDTPGIAPTHVVPRRAYLAALAALQRRMPAPELGFRLGASLSDGSLHLFGPVLTVSATARQVIDAFHQFSELLLGGPTWQVWHRDGHVWFGAAPDLEQPEGARLEAEIVLMFLFCAAERFWGPWVRPRLSASFAFPAPGDRSFVRASLGEEVRFGDALSTFSFPEDLLDHVRPGADETLASALQQFARTQLASADDSWTLRVRRALAACDKPAQLDAEALAATWNISLRSLRRRLESERTTLSVLVEETLYERARQLLSRPTLPLHEVAEALGYFEVSSFQRAFKRWSGLAPGAYRRGVR